MKALFANVVLRIAVALLCAPAFAQTESGKPAIDQALELYQQYSGKTVLRSPNLPPLAEFDQPIPSSDTNGMLVVLENELAKRGIEFIPLRGLFVLAVESGWNNSSIGNYVLNLKPRAPGASISPSSASAADADSRKTIPPGTVTLLGADLNQVLDLYAALVNRNILRVSQLSSRPFKLQTKTALGKNDAIYMLEVLLALSGIASVEDGTNLLQIVPLKQIANLKLQAPLRDADEPLIDPNTVRTVGYARFVPGKPAEISRQGAANDLVAYYAELTGRKAVPSQPLGGIPVVFRAQTQITKRELLYALETVLTLNGLAIVEVDQKTIRVGSPRDQNQAKNQSF